MSDTHLIQRQVFQIDIDSESEFKPVSDILMQLMKNELRLFIDKTLSATVKSNEYVQIDRLEINLGNLDLKNIREEVITAFKNIFPSLVNQKISTLRTAKKSIFRSRDRNHQAILYFIAYGKKASWSPSDAPSIDHSIRTFVRKRKRNGVLKLWQYGSKDATIRARILNLLRIDDLLHLYLTTSKGVVIKEKKIWDNIIQLLQQHISYIPGKGEINAVIKENLMEFLIRSSASQKMDPLHNDPLDLLLGLHIDSMPASVAAKILNGKKGWNKSPTATAAIPHLERLLTRTGNSEIDISIPPLADFKLFLERGYIPRPLHDRGYSNINALFRYLMHHHIEELRVFLKVMGRKTLARGRFLDRVAQPNIEMFFAKVAPENAEMFKWIKDAYLPVHKIHHLIKQPLAKIIKSINEITLDIFTRENFNGISNEAFIEMHIRGMSQKLNVKTEILLHSIFQVERHKNNLLDNKFENFVAAIKNIKKGKGQTRFQVPALDEKGIEGKNKLEDSWNKSVDRDFILPTAVLKELLFLKKTGILGSYQVRVHEFLQDQIKLRKANQVNSEIVNDDIFIKLVQYLQLNETFFEEIILLSRELLTSSSVNNQSLLVKSVEKQNSYSAENENGKGLLEHLIKHRERYQPQDIRVLVNSFLKKERVSQHIFEQLVLILFNDRSKQIIKSLKTWFKINSMHLNKNMIDSLQSRFIHLSLQFTDPQRNLSRIFINLQETVDQEIQQHLKTPEEVRNVFSDRGELVFQQQKAKKRSPVFIKENQLLALYSIIQLENELEGIVSDSFYNNIIYSFDLLRWKYRDEFFEILQKNSTNPEFIQFLTDESNLPIWKAIVSIIPELVSRRMNELIRSTNFLFQFLSLTTLTKEKLQEFIISNAIGFYFLSTDELPDAYSFFMHAIAQAKKEDVLTNEQDLVSVKRLHKNWPTFLRYIKLTNEDKKLSIANKQPELLLKAVKETYTWPLDFIPTLSTRAEKDIILQTSFFTFQFVLNKFSFPPGHAFENESIWQNALYFRTLLQQEIGLLTRVWSLAKTPRQKELFLKWVDEPMAFELLALIFNSTEEQIKLLIGEWTTRFSFLKATDWTTDLIDFIQTRKKPNDLQELIVQYLIQYTRIHQLDVLTVKKEIDVVNGFSVLRSLPIKTIRWKELPFILSLYEPNKPEWHNFILKWAIALDVFAPSVSSKVKLKFFLRLIERSQEKQSKIEISKDIEFYFKILSKLSAADAIPFLHLLHEEGVELLEFVRHQPGLMTSDHFPYEQIVLRVSATHLKDADRDTIFARILEELGSSTNSRLIPTALSKKLFSKTGQISTKNHLAKITDVWYNDLSKDFPFQFSDHLSLTQEAIQEVQKKWSTTFIRIYGVWMNGLSNLTLGTSEPNQIFLFKALAKIHKRNLHGSEKIHAVIFLEIIKSLPAGEKEVLDVLRAMNGLISFEFLLNTDVFYWLSYNLSKLEGITKYLDETNKEIHEKWMHKLGQSEIAESPVEKHPVLFDKKELSLMYEDDFLFSKIQAAAISPEMSMWLNEGFVDLGHEMNIRIEIHKTPVMLLLKSTFLHKTVISKLVDWLGPSELGRQFELLLKANIHSSTAYQSFQKLLVYFFEHAEKNEHVQFILLLNKLIQRNKYWNKEKFWVQFFQDTAALPTMEGAIIQHAIKRPSLRKSGAIKQIIQWHLDQSSTTTIAPLMVLEKYIIGDALTLINSNWTLHKIKKSIKQVWTSKDKHFPFLLFTLSSQELYRRRILELMEEFGEQTILEKIHPRLWAEWNLLENIFVQNFGISIPLNLGVKNDKDLWDMFLYNWSVKGYKLIDPLILLREVVLLLVPKLDLVALNTIRTFDSTVLGYTEKTTWKRLITMVPELRPASVEKSKPWKQTRETEIDLPDEEDAAEGITIQNAGLVLLWPYLSRYFKLLKLMEGNAFVDDRALERAIQLTQYLVNFKTNIDEKELMLNKLLCGAAFKFPIGTDFEPNAEEASMSRKILQGAVQNWDQMKNTRPETFQETFLQREGRLYKMEDRWELVVEKKAYDMLLDSLPWNISMIQLSWMSDRLVVIWR